MEKKPPRGNITLVRTHLRFAGVRAALELDGAVGVRGLGLRVPGRRPQQLLARLGWRRHFRLFFRRRPLVVGEVQREGQTAVAPANTRTEILYLNARRQKGLV